VIKDMKMYFSYTIIRRFFKIIEIRHNIGTLCPYLS